jgi:hypothetical protein
MDKTFNGNVLDAFVVDESLYADVTPMIGDTITHSNRTFVINHISTHFNFDEMEIVYFADVDE